LTSLFPDTEYVSVRPVEPRENRYAAYLEYRGDARRWFSFILDDKAEPPSAYLFVARMFIPVEDLRQVLLDADRAVEILDRAVSIAAARAAEVIARPFQHQKHWFSRAGQPLLIYQLTNEEGDWEITVEAELHNVVYGSGGELRHARVIKLRLIGDSLPRGEEELLRQLAADLAEIFEAPKLAKPSERHAPLILFQAEIWREDRRYLPRGVDRS